jgi:hypothetical protein
MKVSEIKRIISNWGSVDSCELELESSPCINSIGNGKGNVSQLVEYFYSDKVEAVTYNDEMVLGTEFIYYEDLPEDVLEEIYNIICRYETIMLNTEKH